jgi:autotransporter passenger strand-loop-strand repeat protein
VEANTAASATATGTVVDAQGYLTVFEGGIAEDAIINSAGQLFLSAIFAGDSGGVAISSTIEGGGSAYVETGGVASGLVDGGELQVNSGGVVYGLEVTGGGKAFVVSGLVSGNVISAGGAEFVGKLGVVSALTVLSGGLFFSSGVLAVGGSESGTLVVSAGATEVVSAGVTQSGNQVSVQGTLYVDSGGSAVAAQVFFNGTEQVLSGGVAIATVVGGGGTQDVFGTAISSTVSGGGLQTVLAGGVASATLVGSDAEQVVSAGGVAIGDVVSGVGDGYSDGAVVVLSGGVISGTALTGGQAEVASGGSAVSTTVGSGGALSGTSGGVISGATVLSGGTVYAYAGATATGVNVSAGGLFVSAGVVALGGTLSGADLVTTGRSEVVSTGAVLSGVTVTYGGTLYVDSGGLVAGGTLLGGGTEEVEAGGSVSGGTVSGIQNLYGAAVSVTLVDSYQTVFSGGSVTGGVLLGDTVQTVNSGGSVVSAVLGAGGRQFLDGGSGSFATIVDSGTLFVESGSTAYYTTVDSGGTETVLNGTAVSSTVNSGGIEEIQGGNAGPTTLAGTLELYDYGAIGPLTFEGGVLDIEYQAADEITNKAFSDGTLAITVNYETYDIVVPDAESLSDFTIGPDGNGLGIDVTETAATCFVAGTEIATPNGPVPVERLRIGDAVVTGFAGRQKVKFVGRRAYDGRFIAGRHLMLPVCIHAGALGDGVPARALWVSPGHALLVEDVLVPAWRLINCVSITQAAAVGSVAYYHVELERHDVLLAENCKAESFYDTAGLRNQFQNLGEYLARYPGPTAPGPRCRPLVEGGFELARLRRRIGARAGLAEEVETGGPLRGFVDEVAPGRIRGWAQALARPDVPVALDIFVDGMFAETVLANYYRADLRAAGIGSGVHAFESGLMFDPASSVEICRALDGVSLMMTNDAYRKRSLF